MRSSPQPILLTSARAAHTEHVAGLPCEVVVCGEDSVNVTDAVAQLRGRGDGRVLCEGGPTLLDELVAAGGYYADMYETWVSHSTTTV